MSTRVLKTGLKTTTVLGNTICWCFRLVFLLNAVYDSTCIPFWSTINNPFLLVYYLHLLWELYCEFNIWLLAVRGTNSLFSFGLQLLYFVLVRVSNQPSINKITRLRLIFSIEILYKEVPCRANV